MNTTIEPNLPAITAELDAVNAGRWTGQYLELQEGGQFLLVAVDVNPSISQDNLELARADIRNILKGLVPTRADEYSWMAVLKKDGVVVESLMGGCTGALPEI